MARSDFVLVSEDCALIAMDYEAALVEAGFRVKLTSMPSAALRAVEVEVERPSVAVVDLSLQNGLDGAELTRALVSSGIPVVIATGYCGGDLESVARSLGAAVALDKPVSAETLVRAVQWVLTRNDQEAGRLVTA